VSSDLIAAIVALALGTAVVLLGLRRNLSETTRNGLPLFGGDSQQEKAMLALYEGEGRHRRQLSPRQRRWLVSMYLLFALVQATSAVLSTQDRWIHAAIAALAVLAAAVFLLKEPAVQR
jgi:hypothetical protein